MFVGMVKHECKHESLFEAWNILGQSQSDKRIIQLHLTLAKSSFQFKYNQVCDIGLWKCGSWYGWAYDFQHMENMMLWKIFNLHE
jgi:hypothetical protein